MAASSCSLQQQQEQQHDTTFDIASPNVLKRNIIQNPYSSNTKKPRPQTKNDAPESPCQRLVATTASPMRQPQQQPSEQQQQQQKLPSKLSYYSNNNKRYDTSAVVFPPEMNVYYRYFGALLSFAPMAYYQAADTTTSFEARQLWYDTCQRVGLSQYIRTSTTAAAVCGPPMKDDIRFKVIRQHFYPRATLVLEESRHAISTALAQRWQPIKNEINTPNTTTIITTRPGMMVMSQQQGSSQSGVNAATPQPSSFSPCLSTTLLHVNETKHPFGVARFRKRHTPCFRPEELAKFTNGTIVQCVPGHQISLPQVVLGVVKGIHPKTAELSILIMLSSNKNSNNDKNIMDSMTTTTTREWLLTPLCLLISELRQFEACMTPWNDTDLPFLQTIILGQPRRTPPPPPILRQAILQSTTIPTPVAATSPIQVYLDKGNEEQHDSNKKARVVATDPSCEKDRTNGNNGHFNVASVVGSEMDDDASVALPPARLLDVQPVFALPHLNATQEQAATTFLKSAPGSVTIIQGPPGTGKTTLLINIICRYLTESSETNPRLLVCAPTNKAVSVLATRFLQATKDAAAFNAILVGDEDKLLMDESSSSSANARNAITRFSTNDDKEEENDDDLEDSTSSGIRWKHKLRSIFLYRWMKTMIGGGLRDHSETCCGWTNFTLDSRHTGKGSRTASTVDEKPP